LRVGLRRCPNKHRQGLPEEFSEDPTKRALWRAFVRKGRLDVESKTLGHVVIELGAFLMPASDRCQLWRVFQKKVAPNWRLF
jgi:hypothetical protein